jgi:hypothetical protein
LPSSQSATPPSGSNSQTKMTDADTAGIAQASRAEVDTNAAILGPSWFSSSPTRVPTMSVSGTTTAANTTLIRNDDQNSGSDSTSRKFSQPVHDVAAAPVTCGSP